MCLMQHTLGKLPHTNITLSFELTKFSGRCIGFSMQNYGSTTQVQDSNNKPRNTRQVSSMIHSARPIVMPVANIVFCCFVFLDLKSGEGPTDGQTYGRTTCAKTMIPAGRDCGAAEWTKRNVLGVKKELKNLNMQINAQNVIRFVYIDQYLNIK